MKIEVENLSFSYSDSCVLKDINLRINDADSVALLGTNGAGKTTLLKCLLGFYKPTGGRILVDGKDLGDYSRKELADIFAYIPQSFNPAFNHTVLDVVLMGTANRLGFFQTPGKSQTDRATQCLEMLGIGNLAHKGCMQISGGERQLALIARALVQDAKVLLMDEPTANLDLGNSVRFMKTVKNLSQNGYQIILTTHNPDLVLNFCNKIYLIQDGTVFSDKADCDSLSRLYGIEISHCATCGQTVYNLV